MSRNPSRNELLLAISRHQAATSHFCALANPWLVQAEVSPRGPVYQTFAEKRNDALQIGMNPKHLPQLNFPGGSAQQSPVKPDELPLTVRDASVYLGVSVQTVYLWVERKQIPHLRVMGRNIRFLKSDLEPFRATFKQPAGSHIDHRLFVPALSAEQGALEPEKL